MAGEEQAKSDFIEILTNLERKFEIILVKWTNEKDFEIRIRTEIDHYSEDFNGMCDNWVDLFSNVTNTVWVKKISNTGPKIRFRKQYQCWTQGGRKVQKELLFDARRCKAVLDMKVLTDTPLTRKKNKHIRMGLNAVVKINFNHLHPVNTRAPFAFFVHTCPPQPEPPTSPPLIQPPPVLPTLKHSPTETTEVSVSELSDPLLICPTTIMFDTSLATHAPLLPHHIISTHLHQNQPNTNHEQYL